MENKSQFHADNTQPYSPSHHCLVCGAANLQCFDPQHSRLFRCGHCGVIINDSSEHLQNYQKRMKDYYGKRDPFVAVAYSRQRLYQRFLRELFQKRKGPLRLLDFGCGWGYFLSLAKPLGWELWGIELVAGLASLAKRKCSLDIICGDFAEADLPPQYFDVITLWNVFDELYDPQAHLEKVRHCLKPGGLLFLRLPNACFHFLGLKIIKIFCQGRLFPEKWKRTVFIFHRFNYTPKAMIGLLQRYGFSSVSVMNSFPTEGDPYSGKRYLQFFKRVFFVVTQLIAFLTGGKILLASSMEVRAYLFPMSEVAIGADSLGKQHRPGCERPAGRCRGNGDRG